jgi:hypothetical protein
MLGSSLKNDELDQENVRVVIDVTLFSDLCFTRRDKSWKLR